MDGRPQRGHEDHSRAPSGHRRMLDDPRFRREPARDHRRGPALVTDRLIREPHRHEFPASEFIDSFAEQVPILIGSAASHLDPRIDMGAES